MHWTGCGQLFLPSLRILVPWDGVIINVNKVHCVPFRHSCRRAEADLCWQAAGGRSHVGLLQHLGVNSAPGTASLRGHADLCQGRETIRQQEEKRDQTGGGV